MTGREARPGQALPILRALAACVAREIPLRLRDETAAGQTQLRLAIEVDRQEFYRVFPMIRNRGPVDRGRLFDRSVGPGEPAEINRDAAAEFGQTIELCAEAGHDVRIDWPPAGRPSDIAPEHEVLTFTVRVPASAFYALRPHQF
ncbi:MAG: hypothetical protein AB7G21_04665 [Dehalococcoidia bacterium]